MNAKDLDETDLIYFQVKFYGSFRETNKMQRLNRASHEFTFTETARLFFYVYTDQFSRESLGMSACYASLHFKSVGRGSPVVKQCFRDNIFCGHFVQIHALSVVLFAHLHQ